jgi:hypothetical protein
MEKRRVGTAHPPHMVLGFAGAPPDLFDPSD